MTSGNISEEPIVIDNDEAVSKLSDIADAFLLHNRDIFMRVDDSVVRVMSGQTAISKQEQQNSNHPFSKGGNGGGAQQPSRVLIRILYPPFKGICA